MEKYRVVTSNKVDEELKKSINMVENPTFLK